MFGKGNFKFTSALDDALSTPEKRKLSVILKIPKAIDNYSRKGKTISNFFMENFDDLVKILIIPGCKCYKNAIRLFSVKQNTLLLDELTNSPKYFDYLSNVFFTENRDYIENVASILYSYVDWYHDQDKPMKTMLSSETFITNLMMNMKYERVFEFLNKIASVEETVYSSFIVQYIINLCNKSKAAERINGLKEDFDLDFPGIKFMSEACFEINENIGNFWRVCFTFLSNHQECESFKSLLSFYFNFKTIDAKCKTKPFDFTEDIDAKCKVIEYQFKCGELLDNPLTYLVDLGKRIAKESSMISAKYYAAALDYLTKFNMISEDEHVFVDIVRKCLLVPYKKNYVKNKAALFVPSQRIIEAVSKIIEQLKDKKSIRSTLLYWDTLNIDGFQSRAVAKAFAKAASLQENEEDAEFQEFVEKLKDRKSMKIVNVSTERVKDDASFFEKNSKVFQ